MVACSILASRQAAAHRRGGRCFAPTPLGLLDFVARRTTHFAPKAAPFKQVRRVSSRSAQARGHEIKQTQAPRNDAPRPARTRLCRDMVGARRIARPPCSSRQAVPGGGDFCGGCDARPGVGRACALRELTRRSCLNGAAFRARSEFCDADPRPSIAAESERSADRHSMSPRRVPPAASQHGGRASDESSRRNRRLSCEQDQCSSGEL